MRHAKPTKLNIDYTSPQTDLSLAHLAAELARIDLLIQREVRRWRLAGQDPNDDYRGMYVSDGEVDQLLERPFGLSWGQTVSLPPAEAAAFAEAQAQAADHIRRLTEANLGQSCSPRLRRLIDAFKLDQIELDILLICLAPAFDPRYERLYGYLQDDVNRRRPMVRLVLDLLGCTGPARFALTPYFDRAAALFKYKLLEHITESGPSSSHWINQTLHPDETIVAWLMGRYQPHAALGTSARLTRPEPNNTDQLLASAVRPRLEKAAAGQPILAFHGPDQAAQDAAARCLTAHLDRPLLTVNLATVVERGLSPERAARLALRDARLTEAIPYLTGWTACLTGDNNAPSPDRLAELCAHPGPVIVAGEKPWQPRGLDRQRLLLWLSFPKPDYHRRQALWQHYLERTDNPADLDIAAVAGRFSLTAGQIRDAAASARDIAYEQERALQTEDLFAAARTHSSPRLADLARKITPRYTWADLILPDNQQAILREIVNMVRHRPLVLETWGVGKKLAAGAGVAVLFAGPPGTGKTMAAEVIAAELGLDLYKINLASVVSKYIGETEKNLERIFDEAESSNAILFFDEADAIFGKRSEVRDAHDRYANIEIAYLLQRVETCDGITILATNLGGNMDEAFTRRLQFIVDFPLPDADDQRRIWATLFPADLPRYPDLAFDTLAERFDLPGGNIRNILVSAAYLAAADGKQLTIDQLLHGTRRELQKMGRLITEDEDLDIG